jgi:exopolysaccharide production protein ExoZ
MRKIPPYLLLDAWRGVAALWVVIYHACLFFLERNPAFVHKTYYAFSSFGQLGVTMFFIISGYCITGAAFGVLLGGRGVWRYVQDRFRRIYPPYLAATFCAAVIGLALGQAEMRHWIAPLHHSRSLPHSLEYWFANLFFLQVELRQGCLISVFWTLSYEVVFYALIGLFLFMANRGAGKSVAQGIDLLFAGITFTTLLSLLWLLASPETCPFPLNLWYQFGLGALLFQVEATCASSAPEKKAAWLWVRAQAGLIIVLTLFYAALHFQGGVIGFPPPGVEALGGTIFLGILWVLRPFDSHLAGQFLLRPWLWLGTFSYSLYLTHMLVVPFVDAGLRHTGLDQDRYWIVYLVEIAAALVTGRLFYLGVERHFISNRQKRRMAEEWIGRHPQETAAFAIGSRLPAGQSPDSRRLP